MSINERIIGMGVIGTGMVSQIAHLPAISACSQMRLDAVADHNLMRAEAVAKRFGARRSYSNHTELLADPSIDAVIIVTHRARTADLTRDALHAGKHVLAEKPMAFTLEEAEELVNLARDKEKIYAVGFMKRYDPGVQKAANLLKDFCKTGRLGSLVMVRGKNFCSEYVGFWDGGLGNFGKEKSFYKFPVPAWLDPELTSCYEWILNVGTHSLNLIRYLLDTDLSIHTAKLSSDTAASLILEANSVPVSLDFGKSATGRWEETLEFFFQYGRVEVQLTSLKQQEKCASVIVDENLEEVKTLSFPGENLGPWSFTRQMQSFAQAILGSPSGLITTGKDSLKDMKLMYDLFLKYCP